MATHIEEKKRGTGVMCGDCFDEIIERSIIPYIPKQNAKLIGPGSENIATEKDRQILGYYCDECGRAYHKLPSKKSQEKTKEDKELLEYIRGIQRPAKD